MIPGGPRAALVDRGLAPRLTSMSAGTDMQLKQAEAMRSTEAALARGDTAGAVEIARLALDQGIEHPVLLNLRAYWHECAERDEAAHRDLLRARALAPDDITVLNALGLSFGRLNLPREAIGCFQRVIDLQPEFGPAWFNKAWCSEQIGEIATARECYERAITLIPQSSGPVANLASLLTRFGQWDAAKALAERALTLDPQSARAELTLATIEQTFGQTQAAEARLQELLARRDLPTSQQAQALSQLGDLLDLRDETAEAFQCYTACNALSRERYARIYAPTGVPMMTELLGWLLPLFETQRPDQWPAADPGFAEPGGPAQHVFLLGFPRSGTTLLEQMLDSHPDAVTSGERDTISEAVGALTGTPDNILRLSAMRGAALSRHRRRYWERVRSYGFDVAGKVFVDKQPVNTLHLPLIAKLFPKARILFALRDPRDVVLSCFRRRFEINESNFEMLTLEDTARYYDRLMRLSERYRACLPLTLREVRHEALVEDFEAQTRDICAFIGLEWDEAMRNFAEHARSRAIATPSAFQVTKGLNREGFGQWRRYASDMAPVLPILEPWVERWGYPRTDSGKE